MADNTVFKFAVPVRAPVASEERSTIVPPLTDPVETPPTLRSELGKEPLLLEILKAPENFQKHFNMRELIGEIDGFISEEITRLHLKDDKETYQKIVDKYFSQVQDKGIYDQVEAVAKLVKIEKTLLKAIQERKNLLEADPLSLTSDQLLKRLKIQGVSHV
jgi:hypothetical protein